MNKKGSIYFILMVIIICAILILVSQKKEITFSLNGDEVISLYLLEEYEELGANSKICSFFKCKDISDLIIIKGKINNEKLGKYIIEYSVVYQNKSKSITRTVEVLDNIPPTIELKGSSIIKLCPNRVYKEEGYLATDNYDGDITDKVVKTKKDNIISYTAEDSSGNVTIVERTYVYNDTKKPKLELEGKKTVYHSLGTEFVEPGFIATDECEGNLTEKVVVTNNVDINKAGEYTITYEVIDSSGNSTKISRKVIIFDFDTKNIDEYAKSLTYYIDSKGYKVSVGYKNLETGYTYKYNEKQVYYGASLIKTLDAMYVYENMKLTNSLKELVKRAVSISDNSAHVDLVNIIGFNKLKAYGIKLGAKKVLTRSKEDYFGNTIVNDQLMFLEHLYELININPLGDELKSYFINDYTNFLTFDGIPTLMHKYGWYGAYYHDVGIVFDDTPYLIVILTREALNTEDEKIALAKSTQIVNDLSKKIYELNNLNKK